MSQPAQYLESKVLTASQPQLHIMLLDGALRFGRLAKTLWIEGADFADVDSLMGKMTNIMEELVQGLASSKEPASKEISKQLEEQYAFVYRELISSRINENPKQLDSCLKLLTYQRETWKLATEQLEAEQAATPAKPVPMPHMQATPMATPTMTTGLSLEA